MDKTFQCIIEGIKEHGKTISAWTSGGNDGICLEIAMNV